ncbi:MAG: MipA/OmpV family protein [Collimonas sp.]|uniref:MipA/OmpV family protein n=1 Tax=Collimonas sp. TaxID=1963772 RepID=UPI0032639D94
MKKRYIRPARSRNAYIITNTLLSIGVLLALLVIGLLAAKNAQADEAKPVSSENTFIMGAGAGFGPRYSGSDQNMTGPLLLFDYSTPGGFFASTMRGLGYGSTIGRFNYSAALGYRGGREEKNESDFGFSSGSTRLRGMGDIKGSASAILSLGYTPLEWLNLSVTADLALSQRNNGNAFHFGVSSPFYSGASDKLTLAATVSVGDSKYMQTYYGVTGLQHRNSGYRAFKPKSGLYEVNASLSWEHRFDTHWALQTMVGATRLQGDAAKSPLTSRRLSPNGAMYVTYTY